MKPVTFWMRDLKEEGRVEFHYSDPSRGFHLHGSGRGRDVDNVLVGFSSLPEPASGPKRRPGANTIPGQLTFEQAA